MNLNQARVVLRPRPVQEVADLTLRFVAAHSGFFLRLLAPFLFLDWVGTAVLRQVVPDAWVGPWICTLVLGYVSLGLFTLVASELLFHPPAQIEGMRLARRALRALPKRLVLDLARWPQIIVGAGLVVLLPSLAARTLYAQEALLLEGAAVKAAQARAVSLARFHHGRCFALFLGNLLLPALVLVLADMLGRSLLEDVFQLGRPLGALGEGGSYFAITGVLLACPYVACLRFLGYIDLRTRKEGWDIQLRFKAWKAWNDEQDGLREHQGRATPVAGVGP